MEKEKLAIFYKLDKKGYLVSKNRTIQNLLEKVEKSYTEEDIQGFIDKLIAWYSIKFSDQYIKMELENKGGNLDYAQLETMNFERLIHSFHTLELELFLTEESEMTVVRKYLIEMAGLGLIYARNSKPNYGYYRADKLFHDFNDYFGWKLDVSVYDSIMEKNYSLDNDEIRNLLEKRKKEDYKETSHKKTKVFSKIHSFFRVKF